MNLYRDIKSFLDKTEKKIDKSYISNLFFFMVIVKYIDVIERKDELSLFDKNKDLKSILRNTSYKVENKYKFFRGLSDHLDAEYERLPLTNEEKESLLLDVVKAIRILDITDYINTRKMNEFAEFLTENLSDERGFPMDTPVEINKLLVNLIKIYKQSEVCDPFCGSGMSLINLYKRNLDQQINIFGQEKDEKTYFYCLMNMFVNDILNFVIKQGDTVIEPRFISRKNSLKKFDIILSDTLGNYENWSDKFELNEREELSDPFGRFVFGIPSKKRGEYAFLLHILHSLKDTGKAFVIIPHGILYRGGNDERIRRNLVDTNLIESIIGLPENLLSWTKIPVIIIVLNRKKSSDSVLFIDGSLKEKYKQTRTINVLQNEDIEKITETFLNKREIEGFSKLVSQQEIAYNDHNLSLSLYINSDKKKKYVDVDALKRNIYDLQERINIVNKKLKDELESFGL